MHVALVILGAMIGLVLSAGSGSPSFAVVFLAGFAGYALAELRSLRIWGRNLEREVDLLKERLVTVQRAQRTATADAARSAPEPMAWAPEPQAGASESLASVSEPQAGVSEPQAGVSGSQAGASGSLVGASGSLADVPEPPAGASELLPVAPVRPARSAELARGTAESSRAAPGPSAAAAPRLRATPQSSRAPDPYNTAAKASSARSSSAWHSPAGTPNEFPILEAIREFFTGGNTLVRVGILILFFGVAFLLRYLAEHTHIPIQFRLSAVACGGLALLILGWRLRLRRAGYALALQGGGIGILYLTTFAALRLYSLLTPAPAFALLVILAALSAILAVLQDSQAFALLAVTGGFLAPILASTGHGSHVVLFSYYAVVNASILAIAWYKAWRPLNLAGFAFTFIISTAWGALHYNDSLFNSTEPFLALFFALYVAIAILFSMRQPPQLRGYVDGTLVFGTPMAAFGYQSAMLYDRPKELAVSAIVVGVVYLLLAWVLRQRQRETQRLLVEAFLALGVVFLTVATPLGLDSHQSGATWALEAAALVWVGVRQGRALARAFGVALQIIAGIVLLYDTNLFTGPSPGAFLALAVAAVAAVVSAVVLQKYVPRLRSYEVPFAPVLFFFGLALWMLNGLTEIDWRVPEAYIRAAALMFVALSALGCSELARRTALRLASLPALWLLPALLVFAACAPFTGVHHPFEQAGWISWPCACAILYVIFHWHEGEPDAPQAAWLHAFAGWLLTGLLTWEVAWLVDQAVNGRGSWPAIGWMLAPVTALIFLTRLVATTRWPLGVHRQSYVMIAGTGVALYLAVWSVATNFLLQGDPYPFPYVALLNPLDLAQLLAVLVFARFMQYLRSLQYIPDEEVRPVATTAVGALTFIWLNAALLRSLHQWAGVPFNLDAMIQSTLVQTALSIFWTVLALATMLIATRRVARGIWVTGAVLLAVTIVKLFVVDLSHVGTIERIVSFVGVGLLTLVIGYFSPLPPAARENHTASS